MAAPPIPPMRLGPLDSGLAVEELHRGRPSPARRPALPAEDDVDAVLISMPNPPSDHALTLVLTGGPIGNLTLSYPVVAAPGPDRLPSQRISSSATSVA